MFYYDNKIWIGDLYRFYKFYSLQGHETILSKLHIQLTSIHFSQRSFHWLDSITNVENFFVRGGGSPW